ncbi:HIT family protein [Sphingomonas arenae]|uniref:HIT family protein n=1 Tax=Sphingomonas arenae TaxID=2812555 RepID=UPI0019689F53|nr:HIT family protein [Sphingomonas arenae]
MTNATMTKFGYPRTLLMQGRHWALLARPAQVTLGSLVLCSRSEANAYGALPADAFVEQGKMVAAAEDLLRRFVSFDRINYLMLMMVDPNVHFHIIPRYSTPRQFDGMDFPDSAWPGPPDLTRTTPLHDSVLAALKRLTDSSVA